MDIRKTTMTGLPVAALVLLFASLIAGGCGMPHPERPNIIIIAAGSLRADRLHCYGYVGKTSPNLDELAKDSFLFEEAYSASNGTASSLMSLFTAVNPTVHGVDVGVSADRPDLGLKTLAQRLKAVGYYTSGIYLMDDFAPGLGFENGFDRYEQNKSGRRAVAGVLSLVDGRNSRKEPFFVFLDMGPISTTEYDVSVTQIDGYIGELTAGLKDRGILDDTIIVLLSDHGMELGVHDRYGHDHLYRNILHVPLIIKFPKWVAERTGYGEPRRIGELAGIVDVSPTLLETLGTRYDGPHQGISLAGILKGTQEGRRGVFAESRLNPKALYRRQMSLIGGGYQFISFTEPSDGGPGQFRLYDLRTDPEELHDVEPSRPEVASGMAKRIEEEGRSAASIRAKLIK